MIKNTKTIAYFPLNVSLLPGEDIPLRIFEPRYKQLIEECESTGNHFGIPFLKSNEIQSFGSEVRVKQVVAKNSQGEMVIVAEGISNFELMSIKDPMPGKLYAGGKITPINHDISLLGNELLALIISFTDNYESEFLKSVNGNEILLYDVARALNLSSEEKFRFISLKEHAKKERFLLFQLRYMMKLREQEKLLNNDYFLN